MKLELKDLEVSIGEKKIVDKLSLVIASGEIHALMGPNGSGKSTLASVIAGHPKYAVKGDILVDGKSIMNLLPHERAKLGIFLAFQHPIDVQGVSLSKLLFTLAKQKDEKLSFITFKRELEDYCKLLSVDKAFVDRDVNVGLSGGERKRAELLQVLVVKPSFVVFDELDSGLDVDSLQLLSKVVNTLKGPNFSALLITHYARLLQQVVPDKVHIMEKGNIIKSGPAALANQIEIEGYIK